MYLFRFNPGVNRLYCPSEEVAKRALLDGLEESQIQVFGLPIRPSFCRAVLTKVNSYFLQMKEQTLLESILITNVLSVVYRMMHELSSKWIQNCQQFY